MSPNDVTGLADTMPGIYHHPQPLSGGILQGLRVPHVTAASPEQQQGFELRCFPHQECSGR